MTTLGGGMAILGGETPKHRLQNAIMAEFNHRLQPSQTYPSGFYVAPCINLRCRHDVVSLTEQSLTRRDFLASTPATVMLVSWSTSGLRPDSCSLLPKLCTSTTYITSTSATQLSNEQIWSSSLISHLHISS